MLGEGTKQPRSGILFRALDPEKRLYVDQVARMEIGEALLEMQDARQPGAANDPTALSSSLPQTR